MRFEDTDATRLTEAIMRAFSRHSPNAIAPLETPQYNRVFEHVHAILSNHFTVKPRPRSSGGFLNERKIGEG